MLLSKSQSAELITAIKGRGEIPLKFAYIGNGARNWDRVATGRGKDGGINSLEKDLLASKVEDFVRAFQGVKCINLIDIGCGNGTPALPIAEELRKANVLFRYVPVDISPQMLELAETNVRRYFPNVDVIKTALDFELGNFAEFTHALTRDGSRNLLLFLGTTLGNHSDQSRVLTNFRDSMTSDDYLIVGVELTNYARIDNILQSYRDERAKRFVYFALEGIGVRSRDTLLSVGWNDRANQVEMRATLTKDAAVTIGDERFVLKRGEAILLARSVKFSEWSLIKLLSDIGYRNEILTTNRDRSYLLAMVQPTRYMT